jgi:hypothetical protein
LPLPLLVLASSRRDLLSLLLFVFAVILSEAKDPEASHPPIPLEPFNEQTLLLSLPVFLFVIPQGSAFVRPFIFVIAVSPTRIRPTPKINSKNVAQFRTTTQATTKSPHSPR